MVNFGKTYKATSRLMSLCTSRASGILTGSELPKEKNKEGDLAVSKSGEKYTLKWLLTDGHVLCEGHLPLLLDQLLRLQSVVKVELDLSEALQHALLIIDSLLAKPLLKVFFLVELALGYGLIAVLGLVLILIYLHSSLDPTSFIHFGLCRLVNQTILFLLI